MSSTWKNKIEITIFGESHGKAIGVVLGNLPSGIKLDMEEVAKEMKRRAPGQNKMSTARKEADKVEIMSGIQDDIITGAPLCAMIYNSDQHSKDYSLLKEKMRPGHSDYPAFVKYKGFNDVRGGGHFSGRITAPIVFAGAVAKQILAQKGIYVGAHILSIKNKYDDYFDMRLSYDTLKYLKGQQYPVLNQAVYDQFVEIIDQARMNQDSVGGKIECAVVGLEAGLGEPFFDSIESHLSSLLFSIPAVKSVAFGNDLISEMYGSEANDCYYYDGDVVKTKTNNNGGITGGISNGMPIVFNVGIKPTPSISKPQETIDIKNHQNTILEIHGRHDPCIVFRATVVVEAMAALTILDLVR
ncbi:chorismate synthase [Thomasclavelia saccharogumia]|uniref:chorismate synthase n=1 Tax=Thomasclavelia saccharogumia TaxID=341225 RepID=UPI0004798BFB|nr:chorismate synthase [Thomasclavelia saccharogumia]